MYSASSVPLFWSLEASSPNCSESEGVTASYQTPGSRQIWACLWALWLRSQPADLGWAGSPLSQRALGFVLASRQTRPWPQLEGRRRKKGRQIEVAPLKKRHKNSSVFSFAEHMLGHNLHANSQMSDTKLSLVLAVSQEGRELHEIQRDTHFNQVHSRWVTEKPYVHLAKTQPKTLLAHFCIAI